MIRAETVKVARQNKGIAVDYHNGNGKTILPVDMVILAPAIEPRDNASQLAKILGISLDEYGFFQENQEVSSVATSKPGIFIAGCTQGAKNIQNSVSQANAAVGKILSSSR